MRPIGDATFHIDELHLAAFAVPVAFLEVDDDELPVASQPELDAGHGFGARIGFGDFDQSVGAMYVRTTHDEELTGGSVAANTYYLDFSARRVIWEQGEFRTFLSGDVGIGVGTIDFQPPFEDFVGLAAQLRGTLDFQFSRAFALDVGLGGFVQDDLGDVRAFGTIVTVGGKFSF